MNKALKISLILAPILIGGYVIYGQIRKYKVPNKIPIPGTGGSLPLTNNSGSNGSVSGIINCSFPIKNGSYDNACVGQLQDALGITIDNDFGPKTEAALKAATGITVIANQAQLTSVINQIIAKGNSNGNAVISEKILHAYFGDLQTKKLKYIKSLKEQAWKGVEKNYNENWISTGYQLPMKSGLNLSLNDYLPTETSDNGNIVIYCNKGVNMGWWQANPNDITLV